MENFKRMHDSIKPPVWSPASSPNLSESSLVGVGYKGLAELAPLARPVEGWALAKLEIAAHRAKLDTDKFANSSVDRTCWLD